MIQQPEHIEQLSALVLPIDSLLSHPQFTPNTNQSAEIVTLFRSFWLIVAIFRLCDGQHANMNVWKSAALARVAAKTPRLVLEDSDDFLNSDLEYNRAIRKDYSERVRPFIRMRITINLKQTLSIRLPRITVLS
jgi:phosphatidylinositol 4-kinase A